MVTGRLRSLALFVPLPAVGLISIAAFGGPQSAPEVDFARDVEPIFRAHCYQCHGGGQSQGGLRLDSRAMLVQGGANGTAIVPGSAGRSQLVARVLGQAGKPRMPMG